MRTCSSNSTVRDCTLVAWFLAQADAHFYCFFPGKGRGCPVSSANPDPTEAVRWGDQTWDEMTIGYVDYIAGNAPLAALAPKGSLPEQTPQNAENKK